MRAVVQRVSEARVVVDDAVVGAIGPGLLVLLGVAEGDDLAIGLALADKIAQLRIFNDADGKFNLSVIDTGGSALVVSQFTLLADTRKGRRPSFVHAAHPNVAEPLIEQVCAHLHTQHHLTVATGRFGAHMLVHLVNDGPVTITLDSADHERPRRTS
ncbi:MAG: D-tyrosyl-tRNA(Tyr) deacylase [Herpetosiphonaceae bacterium]|nr:D-tyrosyl-tRNA(Tyr) deacylase [Herpetosiphonaceae bacterium]